MERKWIVSTGAASEIGNFRQSNQDSVYAGERAIFVADGVGGHAGGDVASAIVSIRVSGVIEGSKITDFDEATVREVVRLADNEIRWRTRFDETLASMGTTFTGVFLDGGNALVAHIGDSRAYVLREDKLYQITRDDSLVQDLVDSGSLSEEQARRSPMRNIVTSILDGGMTDDRRLHIDKVELEDGDRFAVVSDGVSDYLLPADIEAALRGASTPDEAANALVESAIGAGTRDNASASSLFIGGHSTVKSEKGGLRGAALELYPETLADIGPLS